MKTNWLWDSRLSERAVKKILGDDRNPKFDIYAEKLLARIAEPGVVFRLIDEVVFCKRWPELKRRMKRDRWLKERVVFWQTMYERIRERLRERGVKLREPGIVRVPLERRRLAQELRGARVKLGYTQRDVAERLGVIQQYVSRIESGRENVTVDTLRRIANVFGKSVVISLR